MILKFEKFNKICRAAADDYAAAAAKLIEHAAEAGTAAPYVNFAKFLFTGPVGVIGSRSQLRVVGISLLDEARRCFPNDKVALCRKGEALLPPNLYGKADMVIDAHVLEEALILFDEALSHGSIEGVFLKGLCLLSTSRGVQTKGSTDRILESVDAKLPRALVFLARCYEKPDK